MYHGGQGVLNFSLPTPITPQFPTPLASPLYLELIGASLSLHIIIVFSKQVICHSSNNVSRTRRQYDFSPCFISFMISGLSKKGVGRPVDTQSWQEIM